MKILELFAGTASVGREFQKRGHDLFTVEMNSNHNPDLVADVMDLTANDFKDHYDVIWASPPCTTFSNAGFRYYWNKPEGVKYLTRDHARPEKRAKAEASIDIVEHTIKLMEDLKPQFWFLENPMAMLRTLKSMTRYPRITITYCQYGDTRQKKTDIWGNRVRDLQWRPVCSPKADCMRGPRGVQERALRALRMPRSERDCLLCSERRYAPR